ncbi:pyrroline-5-carboxylate reductase [Maritalea sp.]|jgi:pyrroline-5-carboxylate reductase|uniref:pyrroline-5-carboxylate reductase n=1 Tax=Maritalea sp. TaxID=2003361 RepID=UPI0039E3B8DE
MPLYDVGPVVLVGAGQMGMAMAVGWLEAGLSPDQLILVDPSPSPAVRHKASEISITTLARPPVKPAQVLVLAVKPQVAPDVLLAARSCVDENTLVISVMAGISIAQMSKALGTDRVVRTIPNTPAKIGLGAIGAFAGTGVEYDDQVVVDNVLDASGRTFWVEKEDDINAVTGVSGSGPAYIFNMVEALAAAGEAQGLAPQLAMELARKTVVGSAMLLEAEPNTAPATLRENVTSPNGTTYAAMQILMGEEGLTDLMVRAVTAARKRSEELGRDGSH